MSNEITNWISVDIEMKTNMYSPLCEYFPLSAICMTVTKSDSAPITSITENEHK